ncbi:MAG: cobalt-precorrin hydrolase / cobalt-factor methyltransferase / precorrin-3B [Streptosporangiaceae bacterium]|nr:cobalt-precorrin hydrolase / cobalt-factor methyltransferase / precorrin-3B [Streptosporangiaceae bacterium]
MIGLIAVTAAGRDAAERLARAWPGQTRGYPGPAAAALPRAWAECDALVCFLATGATIRLIAPLLASKQTDPAVVCVDEASRHAIALIGGHGSRGNGANALATRVAEVLGADPVLSTATDAAGLPGLDSLGWPVEGAVAAVSRAMLDGEPVRLDSDATWPLPAWPPTVLPGQAAGYRILITDQSRPDQPGSCPGASGSRPGESGPFHGDSGPDPSEPGPERAVVLRPPSLAVGVGASRGVSAAEVLGLIDATLAGAGLSPLSVAALATVDAKAAEPGITQAAGQRGWPLASYPAAVLAAVSVPNPSAAALDAVGTPSVAEAAALTRGDVLVAAKHKSAMATVAVARIRPRGRLALVGLGPGARDLLPPRAVAELRRASVVAGLDQYLGQVRDLLRPGTRVLSSGLGAEEERARAAVTEAQRGHAVALVGSGDAGVYSMASPALSLAGEDIDVVTVPGITANLAAAALLGAPLGHDHAVISLSDLNTPWGVIERRVRAAAEGDFVITFYNPRSRARDWQLRAALDLLGAHRPASTPAAIVRNANRPGQLITVTTLGKVDMAAVDMLSLVLVGCSTTQMVAGRMVTPRGYPWQP